MSNIKKENIKQEVFDLYDDYAHNRISRGDFMQRLSLFAVGGLTVSSLMSFLMPDYKNTLQVKANDPRMIRLSLHLVYIQDYFLHLFRKD